MICKKIEVGKEENIFSRAPRRTLMHSVTMLSFVKTGTAAGMVIGLLPARWPWRSAAGSSAAMQLEVRELPARSSASLPARGPGRSAAGSSTALQLEDIAETRTADSPRDAGSRASSRGQSGQQDHQLEKISRVLLPDRFPAGKSIAESGRLYIFLNLVSFQKFSGGFEM